MGTLDLLTNSDGTGIGDGGTGGGSTPTPTYSLMSAQVGIADLGNYFTATDVEGALQEIMSKPYQVTSEKGQPFGYAGLDNLGKVPASQLPDFVDDVLEYPTKADFPLVGQPAKIYIPLNTNDQYRYSVATGTYVKLSDTNVLQAVQALSNRTVIITPKLLITNSKAELPYRSLQQIKYANVYEENNDIVTIYTCGVAQDGMSIIFDTSDNLDGFSCTVEYLAAV